MVNSVANLSIEKLPPQNLDAEIGVLASMLLDREVVSDIVTHLRPENFYLENHRVIFESLIKLYDANRPLDLITITDELSKSGFLESVGGAPSLAGLLQSVSTSAHVDEYVRIVREKAVMRNLIHTATEIITRCYDGTEEMDQLLDGAEQKIFDIVQNRIRTDKTYVLKDLVRQSMEAIDRAYQRKGAMTGLESGFKDFDEITSGLQRSDMIVIAARPSMGKTAFALNIAEHVGVDLKIPVGIFSLEMSSDQLVQRMLCSRSQVNLQHVRRGYLSKSDWPNLVNVASLLSEAPIYVDDSPSLSVTELRAKARRLKSAHDVQLIIVDYLQLIQSYKKNSENRQQEISEISRSMKALARELNIPVMVLSQLNRAAENRPDNRPKLSDLRESGAIEQDADVVVLLLRREYYNAEDCPGEAEVIIAKQRNGPTGDVKLSFISEITRFRDLSSREEPQ